VTLQAPFAWQAEGDLELLIAQLPSAKAVFSTRAGGLSDRPYDSLNVADHTGDDPDAVAANRRRLLERLGRSGKSVVWARQVHGAEVEFHDTTRGTEFAEPGARLPEADGQIATSRKLTPLVLVADCLPLVIASEHRVAVVHCGWRGVAAGIIGTTLAGLGDGQLDAAIGPGIGPCCYEVGDEVVEAFAKRGHQPSTMLDLPGIVERELMTNGVGKARIANCGLCTSCNPQWFFSHRRDGERTGRQAGIAWLS
jgi:YfiH family protein